MKLEQGKLYVIYSNNIVDSGVRYYAGKKNGGRVWTFDLQEALVLDAIGVINTPVMDTGCGTISAGVIEVKRINGKTVNMSITATVHSLQPN